MFTVSSGGCNTRHPISFLMSRPNGLNEYLFLLIKTASSFQVGGHTFSAEPDCALIIPPGTPYQYCSAGTEYKDDWLHFSCTEDPSLWTGAKLPLSCPIPLSDPARLTLYVQQIVWEANYASESCRYANVDMLMQILLNNLADAWQNRDRRRQYSPYYTRLQNLRLSMIAEPHKKYLPKDIASSLGISVSYFQHLYSDIFGSAFHADLIRLRVEYAKELIRNTNLTIENITEMCGYSNEVHFYRQFKKYAGMTPSEYRRELPCQ